MPPIADRLLCTSPAKGGAADPPPQPVALLSPEFWSRKALRSWPCTLSRNARSKRSSRSPRRHGSVRPWRCAVCGCIAVEAGKRMARRCRVLLASADTSGKVRLSGVPVPTGA